MNEKVKQIRTDALAAEYIYTVKLARVGWLTTCISVLTVIVPVLFSSVLLVSKGTEYEVLSNYISIGVSAVLLSLSVLSLILQIDRKKGDYLIGRRSNIYVSSEALKVIDEKDDSKLIWFYNFLVEIDARDQENLGQVSLSLKQKAYRDSLMRLNPGKNDTVCSVCNASPFIFKRGNCQICGNTPRSNNVSS
ncbi:mobilome CxxCx(11)CxxC protein [Aeromonas veronii]